MLKYTNYPYKRHLISFSILKIQEKSHRKLFTQKKRRSVKGNPFPGPPSITDWKLKWPLKLPDIITKIEAFWWAM